MYILFFVNKEKDQKKNFLMSFGVRFAGSSQEDGAKLRFAREVFGCKIDRTAHAVLGGPPEGVVSSGRTVEWEGERLC